MTSDSESDLSEAMDPPNTMLASPPPHLTKNGIHQTKESIGSGSSQDEDAMGSDDAEYDIEDTLPPTIQLSAPEMRSTSEPSTTSSKRKGSFEDDDYMLNDPELYGLRRSVRSLLIFSLCFAKVLLLGSCSSIAACRSSPLSTSPPSVS